MRVIKTKQNIERALLHLLKEKSLGSITVTELCEASNITRRTFYLHYESVQQLFEVLIQHLLRELDQSILKAKQNRLTAQDKYEPHLKQLFQHVYDYQSYYEIVFTRHTHFAIYDLFFSHLKKIVKNSLLELREYTELLDFEVAYRANATLGLILEWQAQKYKQSVEEMNQLATTIIQSLSEMTKGGSN